MPSDAGIGGRSWLTELVPHSTGAKIFLQSGIGQPRIKIDGPPVGTISSLHAVSCLMVENVGHGPAETVQDGGAAKVVIFVPGKIQVCFIRQSTKLFDGNAHRDLSL